MRVFQIQIFIILKNLSLHYEILIKDTISLSSRDLSLMPQHNAFVLIATPIVGFSIYLVLLQFDMSGVALSYRTIQSVNAAKFNIKRKINIKFD